MPEREQHGLFSLGELVRPYADHPGHDPTVIHARYEDWPLMVEVTLPDH